MSDYMTLKLLCTDRHDVIEAYNRIAAKLPRQIKIQLDEILVAYLDKHGLEGVAERMNNRTVATILAEYDPSQKAEPIESGEVDGLRYGLYDSNDAPRQDDH